MTRRRTSLQRAIRLRSSTPLRPVSSPGFKTSFPSLPGCKILSEKFNTYNHLSLSLSQNSTPFADFVSLTPHPQPQRRTDFISKFGSQNPFRPFGLFFPFRHGVENAIELGPSQASLQRFFWCVRVCVLVGV